MTLATRLLGAALALMVGVTAPLSGQALVPKVLLIGIDGVRPDVLDRVDTPFIDALIREGAFSDRARNGLPTVSGPNWASMLTGVWKEKHGIVSNEFPFATDGLATYPDFLTRIERLRPAMRTFAVADWPPLVNAQQKGEARGKPVIGDSLDVKLAFDGGDIGWAEADERSVDAAVQELRANDPDAMFVYLGTPDEVSHHTGSIEDEYRASLVRADRSVGRLVAAIRARRTYARESWLILVATDHGRRPDGGHGGESVEERTIFFLASGPAVQVGTIATPPNIVDVAATALAHLGLLPGVSPPLDGVPVGLRAR
jgi:predicted AlkP superfamily pyrophosphatase or phosphodiesterase